MITDWKLTLEDGPHSLHADLSYASGQFTVTWDDALLITKTVWWMSGEIHSLSKGGHHFVLSVRGPWYFGHLELVMDGKLIEPWSKLTEPAPASLQKLQFVQEQNVSETEEIVAVDDFPLDNRFGTNPVMTERQVSRELMNELTVQDSNQISRSLGIELFQALKGQIAEQVSRQTGSRIGEKVSETQSLKFTVDANRSVLYQVVWKRKVRRGEQVYQSAGGQVIVPYRLEYGLSCHVRTAQLDPAGS
jgi:hypothetical protein